jgi:hypothetical protein
MSLPTAPFEDSFDAIEISASAPSREAIERALAMCATAHRETAPGFYLLDDAGGRFIIDRISGIISLKDEALLARGLGELHTARLKVIEPSGACYELELRLRVTGLVPQVHGYERDAALMAGDLQADIPEHLAPLSPWSHYSPAAGSAHRLPVSASLSARFGALLDPAPQWAHASDLRLAPANAAIASAPEQATWSL